MYQEKDSFANTRSSAYISKIEFVTFNPVCSLLTFYVCFIFREIVSFLFFSSTCSSILCCLLMQVLSTVQRNESSTQWNQCTWNMFFLYRCRFVFSFSSISIISSIFLNTTTAPKVLHSGPRLIRAFIRFIWIIEYCFICIK